MIIQNDRRTPSCISRPGVAASVIVPNCGVFTNLTHPSHRRCERRTRRRAGTHTLFRETHSRQGGSRCDLATHRGAADLSRITAGLDFEFLNAIG